MQIRESRADELETILSVELDAFSQDEEIRTLVSDLHADRSALPIISLLAFDGERAVGHVYFTHASIGKGEDTALCMLLAPLAVVQSHQRSGVGQLLVNEAMRRCEKMGVRLVFVLGHPSYYPRFGFVPAGQFGLEAPFVIEEKNADAWMVKEIAEGTIAQLDSGKVDCAQALMKPQYWRE